MIKKDEKRTRLKRKIRTKMSGTSERPRLSVFRSNKFIYAQVIDDQKGKTLTEASDVKITKGTKTERAKQVGALVAEACKKIKINERILLKTKNSLIGFEKFYDDYIYLGGEGADFLASLDVLIVGIDSLSIKKRGSDDHRPHISLLKKNIPIIEGLDLSKVSEGEYDLICLPIKFIGTDASVTRAILIEK